MRIHVADLDPRQYSDPDYLTNCGSFAIVARELNQGLKEIGAYSEPDDADCVGICDGLNMGFKYKDKKSFVINVWDMINVLPEELVNAARYHKQTIFGLSNQVTDLWKRYGISCSTVMPGCNTNFWMPTSSKTEQFTFLFNSFSNVRSGLDLALFSFCEAFHDDPDTKLIIKNTSSSIHLANMIQRIANDTHSNVSYIDQRMSFESIRYLYSCSHVSLNVMRHSSWGLNIHESAACGCLPVVGDFCPSNEMEVGVFLKPTKAIPIDSILKELVGLGLHDAYGNFSYREEPLFYDYDVDAYADLLKNIHRNWDAMSKLDFRPIIQRNWTWKKSAELLLKGLHA